MTRSSMPLVAVVCLLVSGEAGPVLAQERPPAVPVEAIDAILEAFDSHDIVTIQASHGRLEVETFVLSLIRDPRFPDAATDVVVEDGNALYQALMDRYVRGEDVPYTEFRQVWEDTTQAQNIPPRDGVVPALFRTVREVNASLPPERQLRVLLGDPPIDWALVDTPADHQRWIALRDSHPAAVIQLEVLAKGRRALIVYGQGHAQRRQVLGNYDMTDWRAQTIVSILERTTPARVFSLWWEGDPEPLPQDVTSWPVPSLAIVQGTALGATDFSEFSPTDVRFAVRDGGLVPVPEDEWQTLSMEQQFDAVLYLGPASEMTVLDALMPEACADPDYLEMRLQRMEAVRAGPPGTADRLRDYCAGIARR